MPAGKTIAAAVFRRTGLPLVRYRHREAARILMYHRFRDGDFAAQCDHLLRYYRPISLTEAVRAMRAGEALPHHSVILTIDDGYADVYTGAFPVLRARGIPAVVYLVTDFLDGKNWIWTEQMRYLVQHSRADRIEVAGLHLALADRARAMAELKRVLTALPNRGRLAAMAELAAACQVELPVRPPAESQPLSWDQVREMARGGIEFGGHTRSHPILSRVESEAELDSEIAGCRRRIEEELQSPVHHFCYPNGRAEDVNDAAIASAERAGYDSAVSTIWGMNTSASPLFLLRRLGVDPAVPMGWFERTVAGFSRG